MHDSKCEHKIDNCIQVDKLHGRGADDASIDPVQKAGFAGAALQPFDHPRLYLHSHNTARRPNQPRYFDSEKTHAWAGLQYGYSCSDVRFQNDTRILPQLPNRTCSQITYPPRATLVLGHSFLHVSDDFERYFGTAARRARSAKTLNVCSVSDP